MAAGEPDRGEDEMGHTKGEVAAQARPGRLGAMLLLATGLLLGACAPETTEHPGGEAAHPADPGGPSLPAAPWDTRGHPGQARAVTLQAGAEGALGSLRVEVGGRMDPGPGGHRPSAAIRVAARAGRSSGWVSLGTGTGGGWTHGDTPPPSGIPARSVP